MGCDKPEIQLVCFSIGGNLFALDIMRVREIILPQKLSALPGASQILDGVINHRGTLIPVMNIRRRFALPEIDICNSNKLLIIVSLVRQVLALEVDNVMGVITVPVNEITPPLNTSDGIGIGNLLGVCLSDNNVYMLLDIDSLLGPCAISGMQ